MEIHESGDSSDGFRYDTENDGLLPDLGELGYDGVLADTAAEEIVDLEDDILTTDLESIGDADDEIADPFEGVAETGLEADEAQVMASDLERFASDGDRFDRPYDGGEDTISHEIGFGRDVPLEAIQAAGLDYLSIKVSTAEAHGDVPYGVGIVASRNVIGRAERTDGSGKMESRPVSGMRSDVVGFMFQPRSDGSQGMRTIAHSSVAISPTSRELEEDPGRRPEVRLVEPLGPDEVRAIMGVIRHINGAQE